MLPVVVSETELSYELLLEVDCGEVGARSDQIALFHSIKLILLDCVTHERSNYINLTTYAPIHPFETVFIAINYGYVSFEAYCSIPGIVLWLDYSPNQAFHSEIKKNMNVFESGVSSYHRRPDQIVSIDKFTAELCQRASEADVNYYPWSTFQDRRKTKTYFHEK